MSVDNETSIPGTGQSKNTKRQTDKEKIKPIVAPKPKPSGKPRSPRNESPIEDLPEPSPQGAQASYANSLTELPQKRGEVSYLNMSDTGYVGHDPSVEYMFSGTKEDAARYRVFNVVLGFPTSQIKYLMELTYAVYRRCSRAY